MAPKMRDCKASVFERLARKAARLRRAGKIPRDGLVRLWPRG